MTHHHTDEKHVHDAGFVEDLTKMLGRRRVLALLGGLGVGLAAAPASALECIAVSRRRHRRLRLRFAPR
ncbi:hypothetical protein M728_005663 (plasmid) [Ensifer sp. WSM1721]